MNHDAINSTPAAPQTPDATTSRWLPFFKKFCAWMVPVYWGGAAAFFFLPGPTLYVINIGPEVFGIGETTPASPEHFWGTLATSMMVMLGVLCWQNARDPRNRDITLVHFVSKVTSTLGFFWMYSTHEHYFAYLCGIITDLPLAVVTGIHLLRGRQS